MSTSSSNLFAPPPPRPSHDPLNPNPLITSHQLQQAEHFQLMSTGTVEELRLLGCQIIQAGVKLLKMSQASLYTAQILFNQFFARQSFLDFPLIDVVMASVFVAGKVEESIRRARDIVNVFHHLYCLIRSLPAQPIDYVGDTYYIWRDRLCTTEALLLRELGFHVQPASPVGLLLSYMKILEVSENRKFAQTALNYLNDSLKTNAFVLFQPRIIAVSAISLTLDKLNLNDTLLPPSEALQFPWYTLFDVNETELIECKKIILTVYDREFDVLLPLTKEELTIFANSIRPEPKKEEEDKTEERKEHDRADHGNRDRSKQQHYRDDYRYNRDHSHDHSHSHRYRSRSRDKDRDRDHHNRSHRDYSTHNSHSQSGQSHDRN